jgi:hypothetical protein
VRKPPHGAGDRLFHPAARDPSHWPTRANRIRRPDPPTGPAASARRCYRQSGDLPFPCPWLTDRRGARSLRGSRSFRCSRFGAAEGRSSPKKQLEVPRGFTHGRYSGTDSGNSGLQAYCIWWTVRKFSHTRDSTPSAGNRLSQSGDWAVRGAIRLSGAPGAMRDTFDAPMLPVARDRQ